MHAACMPIIRLFALTLRACTILAHAQAISSSLYGKPDFRQKCSLRNAQLLLKSFAMIFLLNKTKQWHRSIFFGSIPDLFRVKTRLLLKKLRVFMLGRYFTPIGPLEFVEQCYTREVYFIKCIML